MLCVFVARVAKTRGRGGRERTFVGIDNCGEARVWEPVGEGKSCGMKAREEEEGVLLVFEGYELGERLR